ncbi:hypothetical protein [Alloactinosynnema sp. L-07]|uniref:DUF2695 domain-containing protein n=1 Tax=Alloactinosynnema sp. L-07 TaxID=1653480 RepID=UPI00065EF05F|nr:DUF2695 domain-containing protein [Alloactinosynnema sp. L-07]CRK58331.1 hypothetical protein [Alloactinosynnema sp. L-07]
MAVPPDKARRKQIRDQYKRAEREARAAALPMSREQLAELVEFVGDLVVSEGCDHTLRHTQVWIRAHDLEWTPIAGGLAELGGYCDCEVVMNCDPEDVFD